MCVSVHSFMIINYQNAYLSYLDLLGSNTQLHAELIIGFLFIDLFIYIYIDLYIVHSLALSRSLASDFHVHNVGRGREG